MEPLRALSDAYQEFKADRDIMFDDEPNFEEFMDWLWDYTRTQAEKEAWEKEMADLNTDISKKGTLEDALFLHFGEDKEA